ncbi:MAG: hypothetical protein QG567_97 [Campylobacterota bacterium]|nr:hypothetical protein [Campylobacterota bacterium]
MKKVQKTEDLQNVWIFGRTSKEVLDDVKNEVQILRNESNEIFRQAGDYKGENYDIDSFKAVLNKFKKYEENVPSMEAVYFFYGDMAHAYLNAKQSEWATRYACALMIMASSWDDKEGYLTGLNAYINIAMATNNYQFAIDGFVEMFEKDDTKKNGSMKKNGVLKEVRKRLKRQENGEIPQPEFVMPDLEMVGEYPKPYSYFYLTNRVRAAEEIALREVALAMGVRKDAVKKMLESF